MSLAALPPSITLDDTEAWGNLRGIFGGNISREGGWEGGKPEGMRMTRLTHLDPPIEAGAQHPQDHYIQNISLYLRRGATQSVVRDGQDNRRTLDKSLLYRRSGWARYLPTRATVGNPSLRYQPT